VMAAVLIEIKSRMLLPRPAAGPQEELDPRAELVRRLLAYEQMKRAAHKLDELPQAGRDFQLVQVWYLSVATVLVQAVVSYLLLQREFRRRLRPAQPFVGDAAVMRASP